MSYLNARPLDARPRRVLCSPRGGPLALVLASSVATALLVFMPGVRFAYDGRELHVLVETMITLVTGFAALVVYGRIRHETSVDNLLLLAALSVFSLGNLVGAALPAALSDPGFRHIGTWGPLVTGVSGAALLVAAGLAPPTRVPRRTGIGITLGSVVAAVLLGTLLLACADPPATGIPPDLSPAASARPLLAGSVPLLLLQAVATLAFAVGAATWTLRGARRTDTLASWIGLGCILLAFARLHYLLFPSLDLRWFYFGDIWRASGFLFILAGAIREIGGYWRRLNELAVLEERRRIARDLHDGLAQELAFLAAETEGELGRAAHRALHESRRAIAALTRPVDEPLEDALRQELEDVAARFGVGLDFASSTVHVDAHTREEVIRIGREAVTNACRHSATAAVTVRLEAGDAVRLRVRDDGSGFEPERAYAGYGLVTMRERARALGGALTVLSAPAAGTTVELVLQR